MKIVNQKMEEVHKLTKEQLAKEAAIKLLLKDEEVQVEELLQKCLSDFQK